MTITHNEILELSQDEKDLVVEKKVTCPFVGPAVAQNELAVRHDKTNPLAAIEEIRSLGNTGGGRLGEVLVLFATANHARMRNGSGGLTALVPDSLFSLEFPGSQGSHPGHSGILQEDPKVLDSGRLNEENFARLISRAKNGFISRSDVGRFIAENILRDPESTVLMEDTDGVFERNFFELMTTIGMQALGIFNGEANHREIREKFVKLMTADNLAGSAGEFGLLFAFFANKPVAEEVADEPVLAVDDLKLMFVEKRLPAGWKTWKKTRIDWVKNTVALVQSAREEYKRLKRGH